jgi:hypothetical protein
MKYLVHGAWLLGVAIGLVGCGATRTPQTVIAPSYSYVQADLAAGINSDLDTADPGDATILTSVSSKLPPIPAAPGFETLVFVPTDARVD